MSRYIDADVLIRYGKRGTLVYWEDIEDAPSIDIVRCKDCKHSDTVTYPSGITEMTCPIMFETDCDDPFCVSWLIVDPNDFCSYGEVRDE